MQRHKAPGLSELVAEMVQATGILDLCNGMYSERRVTFQWTGSHVILKFTKGKVT